MKTLDKEKVSKSNNLQRLRRYVIEDTWQCIKTLEKNIADILRKY